MPAVSPLPEAATLRHDWSREEVLALFDLPFPELVHRAGGVHRREYMAQWIVRPAR